MNKKTMRIETRGMVRGPLTAVRGSLARVSSEFQAQRIERGNYGKRKSHKFVPRVILRKCTDES